SWSLETGRLAPVPIHDCTRCPNPPCWRDWSMPARPPGCCRMAETICESTRAPEMPARGPALAPPGPEAVPGLGLAAPSRAPARVLRMLMMMTPSYVGDYAGGRCSRWTITYALVHALPAAASGCCPSNTLAASLHCTLVPF